MQWAHVLVAGLNGLYFTSFLVLCPKQAISAARPAVASRPGFPPQDTHNLGIWGVIMMSQSYIVLGSIL